MSFEAGDVIATEKLCRFAKCMIIWGSRKPRTSGCSINGIVTSSAHQQDDLLSHRIYGIAMGYEDLNDHNTLRQDLVWQTPLQTEQNLASAPTHMLLGKEGGSQCYRPVSPSALDQFVASFEVPLDELILDFDVTDNRVHGTGLRFCCALGNLAQWTVPILENIQLQEAAQSSSWSLP